MTEAHALLIPDAVKYSGIARTRLYHLMAEGAIDARRAGGRTVIMVASLRAYLDALPKADVRMPSAFKGAA